MTERELARAAARRLAIIRHAQEVTDNVALTCRYYGISRFTYYIWLSRYEELAPRRGRGHREAPRDRCRSTRSVPRAERRVG